MKTQSLGGVWNVKIERTGETTAHLPGTLDENQIGFPDTGNKKWHPDVELGNVAELANSSCILTRLTRNHTYEGPAWFSRTFTADRDRSARVFLEVERTRYLTLQVNDQAVESYHPGSVSTPYVFEITKHIAPEGNTCTLCCDNSYPSWPHDPIAYSSAATDETQTNWNGVLGYVRLRYERENFIAHVRAYPHEHTVDITVDLDCESPYSGILTVESHAFAHAVRKAVALPVGRSTVIFPDIFILDNAERWDEGQGALHTVTVSGEGLEVFHARFGLRTFRSIDGRLALNGRPVFLRSEANCCVFPKTGHMPMTVEEWRRVLAVYRSYGVNCMRFHSHCPPEAAFVAADEMGLLMQPELSHWNPQTAFEDEESWNYYRMELEQILLTYANHPSFVMMTLGNELCSGPLGLKRMSLLVIAAKKLDPTRLYAIGSNNFCNDPIGPDPVSDFFTAASSHKTMLRGTSSPMVGHINEQYPNAKNDYGDAVAEIRGEFDGPVFGFEVGQYEILPDFDEWDGHSGVTRPDNYLHIQERVRESGFFDDWKKRVEATGELSLLAYREEVESVLRADGFSGLSLLGLQDFPGQGTALVGMLNAHLEPKPFAFAQPERFRRFFSDLVPLALLDKYTYGENETLVAQVKIANYTRANVSGPCRVRLLDSGEVLRQSELSSDFPCGKLTTAGKVSFPLDGVCAPRRLTLQISVGSAVNDYPVWVYPDQPLTVPEGILMTASTEEAFNALEAGGTVFLTPEADEAHFPRSIRTQFTTDFWSVGTFPKQEGFMGCMMEPRHPVFARFPTEFHSNWQWWPMCQGRAMILPEGMNPLVTALDCYARMRHMGMLVEVKAGRGRLMISSMGLMERLHYPEVRALTQSILDYMRSERFAPAYELSLNEWKCLVR